jgi:hypothetical protein
MRVCLAVAGVLLVFAAFVNAVHLGYAIRDDQIGVFKSHFTAQDAGRIRQPRRAVPDSHRPKGRILASRRNRRARRAVDRLAIYRP